MSRFFTEDISNNKARITGEDVKHIRRVLRLKEGDEIQICDGNSTEYDAIIDSVGEEEVLCSLRNERKAETESRVAVTLYQGIPKSGKMETIVQKCTELGAFEIVPVFFNRCVSVPGKDYGKKLVRYNRVALEAAKQSRRGRIPEVRSYVKPDEIPLERYDRVLVAYEEEKACSLKSALKGFHGSSIAVVIGPEGGLETGEVEMLLKKGAVSVSLGKRILRTETAGMATLAQIFYEVEE